MLQEIKQEKKIFILEFCLKQRRSAYKPALPIMFMDPRLFALGLKNYFLLKIF